MKTTATYNNILPSQEEIRNYEREDDLARKSQLAKVENKNYKNKLQELRNNERYNLSETEFYKKSLISALTLPEFTEEKVKEIKTNTKSDLFDTLTAENEWNLEADQELKAA